jgi:hypothetical protein
MNVATVFGISIESVNPSDDAVFGVVSGGPGPADSSPARSYGLELRRQRSGDLAIQYAFTASAFAMAQSAEGSVRLFDGLTPPFGDGPGVTLPLCSR